MALALRSVAVALVAAGVLGATGAASAAPFTGQLQCTNGGAREPLAGARMELLRRTRLTLVPVAAGVTDQQGRFDVDGGERAGSYVVRAVLHSPLGIEHTRLASPWNTAFDSTPARRVEAGGGADFGALVVSDPACAAWQAVLDAAVRFVATVRRGLPLGRLTVHDWVPLLPQGAMGAHHILWPASVPPGPRGTQPLADQELARALRLLGLGTSAEDTAGRFLAFDLMAPPGECRRLPARDAFTWGWTRWWSGLADGGACPGTEPGDPELEGAVARRLRDLEVACAGRDRARLWAALAAAGPGVVTLADFERSLGCPQPEAVRAVAPAPPPVPAAPAFDREALLAAARAAVAAEQADVRAARKRLAGRTSCLRPACRVARVRTALELTDLRIAAATLSLVRVSTVPGDPAAAAARVLRLAQQRARWAETGLREALQPLARNRAGAALRRVLAQPGGPLPPSFAPAAGRMAVGAPTTFPVPSFVQPPMGFEPIPLPPAAITLTCPELAYVEQTVTVTGQVTPGSPAGRVRLIYDLERVVERRDVPFDDTGAFGDESYQPNGTGTLVVTARFAGDETRGRAQTTCEVPVQSVPSRS